MWWSEGAFPVLLSLMASAVLEEVVFRHGLQGGLQHAGRLRLWGSHAAWVSPANALSTAAFVLAHGLTRSWALAIAVLPASVCLGCLYEAPVLVAVRDGSWRDERDVVAARAQRGLARLGAKHLNKERGTSP